MQGIEAGARKGKGKIIFIIDVGSRDGAVVGLIAKPAEEALRGLIRRDDRGVDVIEREDAEGEGVQHEAEARAQSLALRSTWSNHDGELSAAAVDVAQIRIAEQVAVPFEQEGTPAVGRESFEMLDHVAHTHHAFVSHHRAGVRVVVVGGQVGRSGCDLIGRGFVGPEITLLGGPLDLGAVCAFLRNGHRVTVPGAWGQDNRCR